MISRTIKSGAQSAPTAVAKSNSTARHAPSDPTLYRLSCAAQGAAPWHTLPRNPCINALADRRQVSLATTGGKSVRCGLRSRTRPLAESGDRAPAKSSVSGLSSAQTIRVQLTPAREIRLSRGSRRGQVIPLPFFYPAGDRVTRDAEGTSQATQTAAFVISAQDLFSLLFRVRIRARLLSTALTAIAAQVPLAAIRSQTITHQPFALAILTSENKGDHG